MLRKGRGERRAGRIGESGARPAARAAAFRPPGADRPPPSSRRRSAPGRTQGARRGEGLSERRPPGRAWRGAPGPRAGRRVAGVSMSTALMVPRSEGAPATPSHGPARGCTPTSERGATSQLASTPRPDPEVPAVRPPTHLPARIRLARPSPMVDCGRHPVKRTTGDDIEISVDVLRDGHEQLRAVLAHRAPGGTSWRETQMAPAGPDRHTGRCVLDAPGRHEFDVVAWVDRFASWRTSWRGAGRWPDRPHERARRGGRAHRRRARRIGRRCARHGGRRPRGDRGSRG